MHRKKIWLSHPTSNVNDLLGKEKSAARQKEKEEKDKAKRAEVARKHREELARINAETKRKSDEEMRMDLQGLFTEEQIAEINTAKSISPGEAQKTFERLRLE